MMVAADGTGSMAAEIARFRRFNRVYTRYLGTLREGMHSSEFPLAEARVLYEMATREAPRSAEIAVALDMDAGYLSRILKKFEEKGLVRRKASKRDARVAELALTAKGRAAFRKLDDGAEEQARATLGGLGAGARVELLHAMQLIERIVAPDPEPKAYVL
ncbi:MAG TPA: MarR family winged helix-turn-helix transcriptional regulator, partial [Terracidiphilus sp.]|nr:MarR family winged helix-turn-helix transcriptional regulator [Terracidiphilus sp.]